MRAWVQHLLSDWCAEALGRFCTSHAVAVGLPLLFAVVSLIANGFADVVCGTVLFVQSLCVQGQHTAGGVGVLMWAQCILCVVHVDPNV
jgi:hypothetical protein